MITATELARHCPQRTFQRARAIAADGRNILTQQVRYGAFETTLSAFVAASSGWADRYRTSVVLDEDENEVIDYSCTCPAFLKYDGMCKHTVALVLSYLDEPTRFIGYEPARTPETSPSIAAFMQRAERVAAENVEAGSIALEPTLVYGFEEFSARFKVRGPRGSYVMKSIGAFMNAVRTRSHVAYGKNLAFTHVPELFDEKARALISFLDRATAQRTRATETAWWRSPAPDVGRSIDLTEGEVVELVDLMSDSPFAFECTDRSLRKSARMTVVDADPRVPLRIERYERGGYVIARDSEIVFAAEGPRMYVFEDDRAFRCTPAFARCADFLRSVYRAPDELLYITTADMPLFCATVLPDLEETLEVDAPPEVALMKPEKANLEFYFDRAGELIEVAARVRYGTRAFPLVEPPSARERAAETEEAEGGGGVRGGGTREGGPDHSDRAAAPDNLAADFPDVAPLRDEAAEERAVELVHAFFSVDATLTLDDEDAVASLLFGGLAQFRSLGEVFTTPAFDRLIVDRKPRVQLGISLAGNLINLDVSSDDLDSGELAALLKSYRRRKRFHRLRNGAYLDLENYDLAELDRLVDDLGVSAAELASGHVELPTYRALYLDREFAEARRDASFTSYVERFRSIDQATYEVPHALAGTLRPYQREGFGWLSALTDMGFGGILADEMGLGKSVQLISLVLARATEAREVGPVLITCPASLVYNWIAEFECFAPTLEVRAVEGTKAERARVRAERGVDVFVCSYDIARIDAAAFAERRYFMHALDEAQYIKNHATLTTRAVKRVNAVHRFALTGTPMENRLSEIWSIFDFLMPGFLGSYARFRERYELGIVGGDEDLARRLGSLVGPFVLRRCKADVLPDLPEKLEQTVYVPLVPEQQRLYAAAEQQLRQELNAQKKQSSARTKPPERERTKVEVLAELMRLRQIALDPALAFENYRGGAAKLGAIMELVEQARSADEKTLVFSQFTSYLATLAAELDQREVPYFIITGATPKRERLRLVNAFNTDDTPVFLVSLKAGGTGLNLTGASVVVHADPWWNAAATNQATDRAHRIGQERRVSVYKVIAKGTVEERILALQEAKRELAESVVGGDGATSLSSLTSEELLELLEG